MTLPQKNILNFINNIQRSGTSILPCNLPVETKSTPSLESALLKKVDDFCNLPHQEDLPKTTHFIFVIDSSGSMSYGKEITIKGYNDQIETVIKEAKNTGETYVTFIDFNTVVNLRNLQSEPQSAPKLTGKTYTPEGGTALYDAVGVALEKALELKHIQGKNTGVFISLLTDGEENSSKYMSASTIQDIMNKLEPLGKFTFGLMGPNKSLESMAQVLSIKKGNYAGFDPNCLQGKLHSMDQMTAATMSYSSLRGANIASAECLYDPKK